MYTSKPSVLTLLSLMKAHGIKHVVLCPGSRNIPFVMSCANDPDFQVQSVTDERSAAYVALGMIEATGGPAAVCCTSGSALANFYPAVTEACYQHLPLVVLSADRPAAWIDQMDGQTIHQAGIFGSHVKKSVQLPEGKDEVERWHANREINDAFLALRSGTPGPVHINFPATEPFFDRPIPALPVERVIDRKTLADMDELVAIYQDAKTRLGLIGQHRPWVELDCPHVLWSTETLGNVRSKALHRLDLALLGMSESEKEEAAPELLITFGGHMVSKRVKQWLRSYRPRHHWHISPEGTVVDLFQSLTCVIAADPIEFLKRLNERVDVPVDPEQRVYETSWFDRVKTLPHYPKLFGAIGASLQVINHLPSGSSLHVANSSAIRYVEFAKLPENVTVWCNRGTSGIEGSLSTYVGFAQKRAALSQTNGLDVLLIGDLSFFYDMNALWQRELPPTMRIVLLNNAGGEIFKTLPGLAYDQNVHDYVMAGHVTSAQAWAKDRGFITHLARNQAELDRAMGEFLRPSAAPQFLEVMTTEVDDAQQFKGYLASIKAGGVHR